MEVSRKEVLSVVRIIPVNRCTSPSQDEPYTLSQLLLRIIINFYFIRKLIFYEHNLRHIRLSGM